MILFFSAFVQTIGFLLNLSLPQSISNSKQTSPVVLERLCGRQAVTNIFAGGSTTWQTRSSFMLSMCPGILSMHRLNFCSFILECGTCYAWESPNGQFSKLKLNKLKLRHIACESTSTVLLFGEINPLTHSTLVILLTQFDGVSRGWQHAAFVQHQGLFFPARKRCYQA